MLTEFLVALQFLTIIRVKKELPLDETCFGRSGTFFPLVGLLIGALVWSADFLLRPLLPSTLLSVFLVLLLAVLSRGFHLDGVANSADSLFGSNDPQRSLAIMKDSRLGTFGALAIFLVLGLKIRAFDILQGGYRDIALLFGPMLGRWACVVMAYSSRPVRSEGVGSVFVNAVQFREFGLASLIALGLLFTITEIVGMVLVIPLGGLIISFTLYSNKHLGGTTEDTFGAVGELIETSTLCLLVVLAVTVGTPTP